MDHKAETKVSIRGVYRVSVNSSGPGFSSFGLASTDDDASTMGNSGAKICTDVGVICSGRETQQKCDPRGTNFVQGKEPHYRFFFNL